MIGAISLLPPLLPHEAKSPCADSRWSSGNGTAIAPGGLSDPDSPSLLGRIEAFPLDEPGASLPFTSRLAREQGWTHAFAARVVGEYRRFLYLAMTAGHPVTPSEEVDQAWHLHLVYTKSYWHGLCRDVLGRDLHHEPTTGGAREGAKFVDWYAKTLESYQVVFGHPAPAEIWPDPARRFANAAAGRWIDPSKFWLISRPAFTRWCHWRFIFNPRRPSS